MKAKVRDKILCSNCGGMFHGLTPCKPKPSEVFYFIAQNGRMSDTKMDGGNFYVYQLPVFYKGQVMAEVESAQLGPAGLEYPPKFIRELAEWEGKGMYPDRERRQIRMLDDLRGREIKAKATLRYALLQTSERKHRLIQYDGTSYHGEEMIPQTKFRFITGPMSYSEARGLLLELMRGVREPDYEGDF